jgi:hypothetical protein
VDIGAKPKKKWFDLADTSLYVLPVGFDLRRYAYLGYPNLAIHV